MALVKDSRDKLAANMVILDAHLASRDYVTGDAFSMGDLPLGTAVQRWFSLPIEREAYATSNPITNDCRDAPHSSSTSICR